MPATGTNQTLTAFLLRHIDRINIFWPKAQVKIDSMHKSLCCLLKKHQISLLAVCEMKQVQSQGPHSWTHGPQEPKCLTPALRQVARSFLGSTQFPWHAEREGEDM